MSLGLAAIVLVGLGSSFIVPGVYTQVNFAAGATTGAPAGQKVLIIGNKTTAGSATPDTVVYGPDTSTTMQSETDVIAIFGAGSQVHRAWRRFSAVNKTTPIYAIAAAESAGTAATGAVVVKTTATSAGNIRFYYSDEFVDVGVATGDTATTIGGNIATAINNNVNWAITAVNTSGVVAVTAKNKGPEGNWLKIGVVVGPGSAPGGTTVTTYGTVWVINNLYVNGQFVEPPTANGYYYQESTRAPASGTGATNTQSSNTSTITGVTGATADWVGQSFVVTDASHSANTGTFTITAAGTGTVTYTNATPGVNSTTINWSVTFNNTSFSSAPSFPTTIGSTVNDGGCTWTCWGTYTGVGVTSLGGGATADNYTNALVTIAASTYFNIVPCDSDATNLGRVVTQVVSQALPLTGILQRVFGGSVDTISNAETLAEGINSPQFELEWGACLDITPLELAANQAAIYSLYEQSGNTGYRYVGRLNFSNFPTANEQYDDQAAWLLSGSRNGPLVGPSTAQIISALNNGVTPVALQQSGAPYLVKRITSRSLNGATQDYRIRDAHKVAIMFAWANAAKTITQQQFGGKDLLDPPKQGQSPAAGQPPNTFATNVVLWGNALKDLTTKVGEAGLLQNTDVTNANAIVQREASPRTRMSASFDLETADIADVFAVVASQVA